MLNIRSRIKARFITVIAAIFLLLPVSARAEDYVLTFENRTTSPHEIVLPLQIKFAVNLHKDADREEKRAQLHDKILAYGVDGRDQSAARLNVARLDQRQSHIE